METFPNLQFIVSTHSPLVLTGISTLNDNSILLMAPEQTKPIEYPNVYGLDYNSALQEIMSVGINGDELKRLISNCAYMYSKGLKEQADNLKRYIIEKKLISEEEVGKRIDNKIKEYH